jgi:hypothetical protein
LRVARTDADQGVSELVRQAQSGPQQVSIQIVDCRETRSTSRTRVLWAASRIALGSASSTFIAYGGVLGLAAIKGMTLQQKARVRRLESFLQFANLIEERSSSDDPRHTAQLLRLAPVDVAVQNKRVRPVVEVVRVSPTERLLGLPGPGLHLGEWPSTTSAPVLDGAPRVRTPD